jgi:hypothetical protein
MLLRRYGKNIQSVEPNFQANALTEIGFIKTDGFRAQADDFADEWEAVDARVISGTTVGDVKSEVESALLADLLRQLDEVLAEAGAGAVVLVENALGQDHPKTRDSTQTLVVDGENRLRFTYTVDPPLRVGVYRRKAGAG